VLVEDISLRFDALGQLPGPFIKWFLESLGLDGVAKLLDKNRKATAEITFAYFDGELLKFFDGQVRGSIADKPRGKDFGWNPLFIPEGADKTYAEMDKAQTLQFSLRTTTVFPLLKEFLTSIDKA
jgi:non-canonical purine NTP pyrophosphatase (RdgB/HAM1 family)